ncbi:MAG: hypothetical protein GX139_01430 [Armatimonadetes bacterium]|jgi:hypothetical protein|nr:hypothetical protein [Armatimonadota bacterium]
MKAGIAKHNITPPIGVELTGYLGRPGPSNKKHDDLFATALALDDGDTRIAIVSIDILGTDMEQDAELRAAISAATGIDPGNLMIVSTHTHAGPAIGTLRGCGEKDESYVKHLWQMVVDTVKAACEELVDAKLLYAKSESELAWNRREWVIDGKVQQSPTSGVITDPQVSALLVEMAGREPVLIYNYACHGVVMDSNNLEISADWIGAARDKLESSGSVGVSMFLQGCCGNINPRWRGTFAEVERAGLSVAEPLLEQLPKAQSLANPKIKVAWRYVDLPYNPLPDADALEQEIAFRKDEFEKAKAEGNAIMQKAHRSLREWAQDALEMVKSGGGPEGVRVGLQAVSLGDVIFVTLPGEAFCEYGIWFREMTDANVIPAAYANGNIGYIPTAEAHNEGGYEVDSAIKYYGVKMIGPGSEKVIVDAVRDMLKEIA